MFQAAALIPACCDEDSPALVLDALAGVSDMTESESMVIPGWKRETIGLYNRQRIYNNKGGMLPSVC